MGADQRSRAVPQKSKPEWPQEFSQDKHRWDEKKFYFFHMAKFGAISPQAPKRRHPQATYRVDQEDYDELYAFCIPSLTSPASTSPSIACDAFVDECIINGSASLDDDCGQIARLYIIEPEYALCSNCKAEQELQAERDEIEDMLTRESIDQEVTL